LLSHVVVAAAVGAATVTSPAAAFAVSTDTHFPAPANAPASRDVGPGYMKNPFPADSWVPARTDQGVDYLPKEISPVAAIGPGRVIYSTTSSGWPGGAFLGYVLTRGSHAGQVIYVAEHLQDLPPVGTHVEAGDTVATAFPGYPWIETGWANQAGNAPADRYNGRPDGTATDGGKAFARFLQELGAAAQQDPGPGPDRV